MCVESANPHLRGVHFNIKLQFLCVLLCATRKQTITSEYEPILDSNNPLSLNRDNHEHGNYCILTSDLVAFLSFSELISHIYSLYSRS